VKKKFVKNKALCYIYIVEIQTYKQQNLVNYGS